MIFQLLNIDNDSFYLYSNYSNFINLSKYNNLDNAGWP